MSQLMERMDRETMDLGVTHRDTEKFVSTTATLTLRDRTTRASVEADASYTVTLPPVGTAQGLTFAITAILAAAGICTVADAGDAETAIAHQLDTSLDHVVMYSDGVSWVTTVNGIA